jgi:hypothetical protein
MGSLEDQMAEIIKDREELLNIEAAFLEIITRVLQDGDPDFYCRFVDPQKTKHPERIAKIVASGFKLIWDQRLPFDLTRLVRFKVETIYVQLSGKWAAIGWVFPLGVTKQYSETDIQRIVAKKPIV